MDLATSDPHLSRGEGTHTKKMSVSSGWFLLGSEVKTSYSSIIWRSYICSEWSRKMVQFMTGGTYEAPTRDLFLFVCNGQPDFSHQREFKIACLTYGPEI